MVEDGEDIPLSSAFLAKRGISTDKTRARARELLSKNWDYQPEFSSVAMADALGEMVRPLCQVTSARNVVRTPAMDSTAA